jgi:hypothetical protein
MSEPEPSSSSEAANAPPMSLGGRLANIFVSPAEVFDEVKAAPPQVANWVVPLVAAIIMGVIYSIVVFSQPTILQKMKEPVEKKFQQMVDTGKITRQKADESLEMVEKFMTPEVFKVVGILSCLFMQPAMLFLVALIIWLLGTRGLGGAFDYMKAVEVVGLSAIIMIPGTVVSMLLAVIYGNLYVTPGPALLIANFDATNKIYMLLSAIDVVSLWYVSVLSIGLSRLSGASFLKSALWGFGLWAVFRLGPTLIFGGK